MMDKVRKYQKDGERGCEASSETDFVSRGFFDNPRSQPNFLRGIFGVSGEVDQFLRRDPELPEGQASFRTSGCSRRGKRLVRRTRWPSIWPWLLNSWVRSCSMEKGDDGVSWSMPEHARAMLGKLSSCIQLLRVTNRAGNRSRHRDRNYFLRGAALGISGGFI